MTSLQIFAFFGVPVMTVAFGYLVYWLEGRRLRAKREPDLFDNKPHGTPGE
jgi:hypothetical protein